MKKVITYGTFDLLHQGHINLLRHAKALGDYLIVGVTTDTFDLERGKMNTCNNMMERIEAVKATGIADQIVIEEYKGQKIDDIQKYGVDIFAIGSDWVGHFDYLKEYCEVVYLPRTEGVSSSMLRAERPTIRLGVVGTGSIARRFVPESRHVANNEIVAVYNPHQQEARKFCMANDIGMVADSYEQLLENVDAVYIASPHATHYDYTKKALESGKHVLCETPFVFLEKQAEELLNLAKRKSLVLMVGLKTAYCSAFRHLVSLLKSGVIGEIVEVSASVTSLTEETSAKLDYKQMGGSMNENACFPLLPIFKLLGTDYENITFYSKMHKGVDLYTKAVFKYKSAVASFQVGLGVKSEGNMVISGTKGYAYVAAPWWKTDYFEIRFEDQNLNKKFFYPYDGEGLRYEVKDFISAILTKGFFYSKISPKEHVAMAKVQELYLQGHNLFTI